MAPHLEAVTTSRTGYSEGDYVAIMDSEFAARLDNVIRQSKDCEDGRKFDEDHIQANRLRATHGQLLCGAIAAFAMAFAPQGKVTDLLSFNFTDPNTRIEFSHDAGLFREAGAGMSEIFGAMPFPPDRLKGLEVLLLSAAESIFNKDEPIPSYDFDPVP